MRVIVLVSLILSTTIFSGCERNDYQHPMHRNGTK